MNGAAIYGYVDRCGALVGILVSLVVMGRDDLVEPQVDATAAREAA
jgi:hypothetical protein